MSVVSDEGRYFGSSAAIRGACWPTCPERVTERQIAVWMTELTRGNRPLVVTYSVNDCLFLEIQDFGQRIQRKSKFPEPLPNSTVIHGESAVKNGVSRSRITESESESVSECDSETAPSGETTGAADFHGTTPDTLEAHRGHSNGSETVTDKPAGNRRKARSETHPASTYEPSWDAEVWPSVRKFVALHNSLTAPSWPAVRTLDSTRIEKIKRYVHEFPQREFWERVFSETNHGKFLSEYRNRGIDWLLTVGKDSTANCVKVEEGKYRGD